MLVCLRIDKLAVIDHLEVELGPGMNVITGETGAGKSILVAAIQLVLGARARADLVRTGAERCEVEALFDLSGSDDVRHRLQHLVGLDGDELVLRRVVSASGRSRAYINGRLSTVVQLSQVARELVDISSQHDHHRLVDAGTHLAFLDAFACLAPQRSRVSDAYDAYRDAAAAADRIASALGQRGEREALLRFQVDELRAVDPKSGEDLELADEHARLGHAEALASAAHEAVTDLYDGDTAVCARLARRIAALERLGEVDADLAALVTPMQEAAALLEDTARELGTYARSITFDPSRLAEVEARLAALKRIARRFGGDLGAAIAFRSDAEAELAGMDDLDADLDEAEQLRAAQFEALTAACQALTLARGPAAAALGQAITSELSGLGMGEAQVVVDVAPRAAGHGPTVAGAGVTADGADRVEFLIAPNRGEDPRPLRRIASGGELSRALLAVKCVLADQGPRGIYVFDEVDTGISGGIAEVVGRNLHRLGRHHQVLCITHQAQVAAYGDRHLHVSKVHDAERTRSQIDTLDANRRIEELARIIGGVDITDTTRRAASELLAQGEQVRTQPEPQISP